MKKTAHVFTAIIALLNFSVVGSSLTNAADSPEKSPQAIGCGAGEQQIIQHFQPVSSGPLHLDTVYCLRDVSGAIIPPLLSPDATKYIVYDHTRGLLYGALNPVSKSQRLGARVSLPGFGYAETMPFQWAADSRSIFGVHQDTQPNGFALGPFSPMLFPVGEPAHPLPELKHRAGNLDGLLWVGNGGLALAEFGTKGGYYRPEHSDARPSIAMVDGLRGAVLQAVQLPAPLGKQPQGLVGQIDARIDDRGKIYALFVMNGRRWFEWRQGKKLRALPIDAGDNSHPRFAITPDLTGMLMMQNLSASGVICEHNPECPQPVSTNGVIARLLDIPSGNARWQITGKATNFSSSLKPAISPNGKYGLINMPPDTEPLGTIALISMHDGTVLQSVSGPHTSFTSLNFSADGKSAWMANSSFLTMFRVQE